MGNVARRKKGETYPPMIVKRVHDGAVATPLRLRGYSYIPRIAVQERRGVFKADRWVYLQQHP
jgi:hypothetical protein